MIASFKNFVGGWVCLVCLAAQGAIVGLLFSRATNIPIGIIGGFLTSMIVLGVLWSLTWATRLDAKRHVRKHYQRKT